VTSIKKELLQVSYSSKYTNKFQNKEENIMENMCISIEGITKDITVFR
jgi:cytochrome b involved in lipid metabolism